MHGVVARKQPRPVVRCLSALAEPQARGIHPLRSRPARPASLAAAAVIGNSPEQAIRGFRRHRAKAFPAQLVPALARRRRQMLVSLWALPLSEGRSSLQAAVRAAAESVAFNPYLALPPPVTPNPSFKRTASPPLNSNVRPQKQPVPPMSAAESQKVDTSPPTPLDPSLVKAGETLVLHAMESRREICKTMLTTTAGSLGAYLALLGLILDKNAIKPFAMAHPLLAAAPVLLFLVAASLYVGGFYHYPPARAPQVLSWLKNCDEAQLSHALERTLDRRWKFLLGGNVAFWLAVGVGLLAAYYAAVA